MMAIFHEKKKQYSMKKENRKPAKPTRTPRNFSIASKPGHFLFVKI